MMIPVKIDRQDYIGYLIMVVGLFMAILDIQIVASSLGDIQASLSASLDEISWVQTAYLIAEVIIIPVTGWLIKTFSTRYTFSIAAGIFTLSSVACACAWSFESMIAFRAVQGFFGGAMIPLVFASIFVIFPKDQQGKATIIAGLVATIAPSLGPTLGGWLTSNFSWHWLFLINIVPGLFVTFGVLKYVHIDQPDFTLIKKFDYIGFICIVLCLGGLEIFLKEGSKNDWFESNFITLLTITIVSSVMLLIYYELKLTHPLVELRAFKNVNFSIGCILSFTVGVGLFGVVYLVPVLLNTVKGYNSLQIGTIMAVWGIFQFLSAPLAGFLEKKMDLRLMLVMGIGTFGFGCLLNSYMTTDVSSHELFWPQVLRGFSLMFCFLPMTSLSLGTLLPAQIPYASGLYNLMRNLGGAIGIAVISQYLRTSLKTNKLHLASHINDGRLSQLNDSPFEQIIENMTTDPYLQETLRLSFLSKTVYQQALVKSFNEVFFAVGLYLISTLLLIFFIRKVNPSEQGGGGH